jgi:hypothetical protein
MPKVDAEQVSGTAPLANAAVKQAVRLLRLILGIYTHK